MFKSKPQSVVGLPHSLPRKSHPGSPPAHTRLSRTPFSLWNRSPSSQRACVRYLEYSANSLSTLRKHELSSYKSQAKCHLLREGYPDSSRKSTSLITEPPATLFWITILFIAFSHHEIISCLMLFPPQSVDSTVATPTLASFNIAWLEKNMVPST